MSATEDQLEQLEAYMDGELHAEQEDALSERLRGEPDLASALEMLRGEREVRKAVWRGYEPSEAAVQRLVMKIEHAVDRHNVWARRLAKWRIPSAAAACILIGFMVGWVGRGTPMNHNPSAPGSPAFVSSESITNPVLPIQPRSNPGGGLTTVGTRSGPVDLPIVDQSGRQIGVQRFNSFEEAARFVEDLHRAQEKLKSGTGAATGEEKF